MVLEQALLLAASLFSKCQSGDGIGKDELVLSDFFSNSIPSLSSSFHLQTGEEWNPNEVESVSAIGGDELKGYLIDFDTGYFAVSLDCSLKSFDPFFIGDAKKISTRGASSFFSSSSVGISLEEAVNKSGFNVVSSAVQIPYLKTLYDSSKWGNWKPISVEQGAKGDCGPCAATDLLLSYKASSKRDMTKGLSPTDLRLCLDNSMGWTEGSGTTISTTKEGLSSFLPIDVSLANESFSSANPTLAFFDSSDTSSSHVAVVVGKAQSDGFWQFKQNWSIIVTSKRNYVLSSSGSITWCDDKTECFHLVDDSLKVGEFGLILPSC